VAASGDVIVALNAAFDTVTIRNPSSAAVTLPMLTGGMRLASMLRACSKS
jgi:hypothetical protein